jgi:hypothetical protein
MQSVVQCGSRLPGHSRPEAQGDGSMTRSFAFTAAAALAVAPLAAQAAPPRVAAPVAEESEAIGGSPFLIPIVLAIVIALGIVLITDGEAPESP